ncbi:MAG TPA: hypothetical protein PLK30_21205 [Blastocatellia bacterium]|nr:hypothetical protein [Blastocatellia bacterium]
MSKKNGDRAKHNREDKKRKIKRRLIQRETISSNGKATESLAANADHSVTSRLRQLTRNDKAEAAAFEIVVYRSQQGEQSD